MLMRVLKTWKISFWGTFRTDTKNVCLICALKVLLNIANVIQYKGYCITLHSKLYV